MYTRYVLIVFLMLRAVIVRSSETLQSTSTVAENRTPSVKRERTYKYYS